jgi:hypothetical protein
MRRMALGACLIFFALTPAISEESNASSQMARLMAPKIPAAQSMILRVGSCGISCGSKPTGFAEGRKVAPAIVMTEENPPAGTASSLSTWALHPIWVLSVFEAQCPNSNPEVS